MTDAATQLRDRFKADTDKVLLSDESDLSYGQVWANASRLVGAWVGQGVRPGDIVAIALRNDPAILCCYLACFIGGFVAAPINPELGATDVDFIIGMIKPKLVLQDPPLLDHGAIQPQDWTIRIDPSAAAAIFFTSGTTGRPKGVLQSLNALVGNVVSFNALMNLGPDTRMYHVMPMTYMAGFLNTMLSPIMAGGSVVIGPRFSPQVALDFWTRPRAKGANTLWLSPSMAAAPVPHQPRPRSRARGRIGFPDHLLRHGAAAHRRSSGLSHHVRRAVAGKAMARAS